LLCKVFLQHHYFRSTHLRFHLANCKHPFTVFLWAILFTHSYLTCSLCVIEPVLIPHETSGAIALELTSKFVTFEITSASQIIIEISWHVRDTITIPWSSVCLAQICRPWRAWPMSKSIILFKSSNYKLWFRILSMSAEPCPSCNIHVHLAIHRLHRGNYSKDLPDSRTGIAFRTHRIEWICHMIADRANGMASLAYHRNIPVQYWLERVF